MVLRSNSSSQAEVVHTYVLEKQVDDIGVTFIRCYLECCPVLSTPRIDVGALVEKKFDDIRVTFNRCCLNL